MRVLRELELDDHTLIVWTSDNGAVQRQPPQGSNAPYRGFGYDTSEGAMRMPCVMRWSGRIPADTVCDELCSTMDLLPTFASLAGATVSHDRPIDGHDIQNLLFAEPGAAKSPWDDVGFFYYRMDQLQAIRSGPWKLYLPLDQKLTSLNRKTAPAKLKLYDVKNDVPETQEVSQSNQDVVQRLLALADHARADLGDMDRPGRGQRPAGWVDMAKAVISH